MYVIQLLVGIKSYISLKKDYLGELVEASKEFVEDLHKFFCRTLGRECREPDNVSEQDAANESTVNIA